MPPAANPDPKTPALTLTCARLLTVVNDAGMLIYVRYTPDASSALISDAETVDAQGGACQLPRAATSSGISSVLNAFKMVHSVLASDSTHSPPIYVPLRWIACKSCKPCAASLLCLRRRRREFDLATGSGSFISGMRCRCPLAPVLRRRHPTAFPTAFPQNADPPLRKYARKSISA